MSLKQNVQSALNRDSVLYKILTPPHSLRGKVLRLPFRLLPPRIVMPVMTGRLRGMKWISGSSDHSCWLGIFESVKQNAFSAQVSTGQVVFDVGANAGFFSLLASVLVGSKGMVFSFEPAPRNLHYLRQHLELNRINNCVVFDCAVSSSSGWAEFDTGASPLMGHLAEPGSTDTFTVRKVTLDQLVLSKEISVPDLIKFDIEGEEYNALLGASQILDEYGPVILCETHGQRVHGQCCELLAGLGYTVESLDERRLSQTSEIVAHKSTVLRTSTQLDKAGSISI